LSVLKTNKTPLVIDADALNILSKIKMVFVSQNNLNTTSKKLEQWKNGIQKRRKRGRFPSLKKKCVIIVMKAHPLANH
jgi:NAD(P)H-hydrate repair Nnr-like enzyme with NAD(P)H-hydrate dehydratase domain